MSKLWIAMVAHKTVPGDQLQFFLSENEPTKKEVLERFADMGKETVSQLRVEGMFSYGSSLGEPSLEALRGFLATVAKA